MTEEDDNNVSKYLVYQLGSDHFATQLVDVREVIEYRDAKPIPHMAAFYKGIINVRGEIIGVIDMRERLDLHSSARPTAMLVFETPQGALAAIVDKVNSVSTILEENIDRRPAVKGRKADSQYFGGVAKIEDRLVTIIQLKQVLIDDQTNPE